MDTRSTHLDETKRSDTNFPDTEGDKRIQLCDYNNQDEDINPNTSMSNNENFRRLQKRDI